MNVLHIAASLDGGAGIGLYRYHRALRDAGVHSRILVLDPPSGLEAEVGKLSWKKRGLPFRIAQRLGLVETKQERIRAKVDALNRTAASADYELFTPPFSHYCPEDHPWLRESDIVSLHWVAGILDWPRFFRKVRKPIVLTLHDQQPYLGGFHYSLDATNNPHLAKLEAEMSSIKQTALRGHRIGVVANSRWNADEARRSEFFDPDVSIETVYYPIDAGVFRPQPKPAALAAFGIPADHTVIGFACQDLNNRRKGFRELISALKALPKGLQDSSCLLSFGRDPKLELRNELPLRWHHLGSLNSDAVKAAAYSAMDIFVVPSQAEAFGLTALEASSCGTAVIAAAVGGLIEALDRGNTGLLYSTEDGTALVGALESLLVDVRKREALAKSGRALAIMRHRPDFIGTSYLNVARALLSRTLRATT